VEEVMSAIWNDGVNLEVATEVVGETDDGLVEVGSVSETKGGVFGASLDLGNGWRAV
jgi:hypothetical protein